jgi:hypothetical protein
MDRVQSGLQPNVFELGIFDLWVYLPKIAAIGVYRARNFGAAIP